MHESEAMAVLTAAKGIGYAHRAAALRAAGSALAVLADPAAYAAQLGYEGVTAVRRSVAGAQRMLDALYEDGVHLIVRGSEGYPQLLAETLRPPHLLYVKGSACLQDRIPLAIVGTRRADSYGLRHTRGIARELAEKGMCIVSGLALGIDAQAHEGALDAGGRTIAVLGSALDKLYPTENKDLMRRILDGGGSVVSEYPPETAPTRYSFLERNRIIAGLSLGVLVTRAPHRSGALSTAQRALDEGREVFAIPGDIDKPGSQLPNRLISEGAHVVTCAEDILRQLVLEPGRVGKEESTQKNIRKNTQVMPRRNEEEKAPEAEKQPVRRLDSQEQAVFDILLRGEADFDDLCAALNMEPEELGSVLMMMELDGIIEALAGNRYRSV